MATTFKEKLNDDTKDLPKIVKIDKKMSKRWGTGTCAIAHPKEIDQIMKRVPKGKVITINKIRDKLTKKYKTNITCPITTGIFARIAAGAAEEDQKAGKKRITPYWRTLKDGGVINEKYPGGVTDQAKLLREEGLKIGKKGKKLIVKDYENYLVK